MCMGLFGYYSVTCMFSSEFVLSELCLFFNEFLFCLMTAAHANHTILSEVATLKGKVKINK